MSELFFRFKKSGTYLQYVRNNFANFQIISLNTVRVDERRRGRVVRAALLWCKKSSKSVSSRLGFAMRRLDNSLCQPNSKLIPFSN